MANLKMHMEAVSCSLEHGKKTPWYRKSSSIELEKQESAEEEKIESTFLPPISHTYTNKRIRKYKSSWTKDEEEKNLDISKSCSNLRSEYSTKCSFLGRLSWDTDILELKSTQRPPSETKKKTQIRTKKSSSITESKEDNVSKLVDRFIRANPGILKTSTNEDSILFKREDKKIDFQYTSSSNMTDDINDEEPESMENKLSKTKRNAVNSCYEGSANSPELNTSTHSLNLDENSESDEESDSNALSNYDRNSYFGECGKKNFFELYKTIQFKPQNFVPSYPLDSALKSPHVISPAQTSQELPEMAEKIEILTPRTKYISACVTNKYPPLPILIRKDTNTVFDFSSKALGDKFIIQFARSLKDIPFVEEINVCDNRLSDNGIHELLVAIENKPDLKKLDISQNEIGSRSAAYLLHSLQSSLCTIHTLVLSKADIDDDEAAAFMQAMEKNTSIKVLILSHNKIGEKENLNAVQPEFITGGEAIASMLSVNQSLTKLDVSWNLLRLESATTLASSLNSNQCLLELNVSYNAFGDNGAMVFGNSLKVNRTLKVLDLSYNNFGTRGVMVLGSAIISNKNSSLCRLELNGNNIGKEGGKFMMLAMAERHGENGCCVGMKSCNLGSKSMDSNIFNSLEPAGNYSLDLCVPYDQMIASELLRLATVKEGCKFGSVMFVDKDIKKNLNLIRSKPKKKRVLEDMFNDIDKDGSGSIDFDELVELMQSFDMRPDLKDVEKLQDLLYKFNQDGTIGKEQFVDVFFSSLFLLVDEDNSQSLDSTELERGLKILGLPHSADHVHSIINKYDIDGSGTIEASEFADFLRTKTEIFLHHQELSKSVDHVYVYDSNNENTPWIVPSSGKLLVEFIYTRSDSVNEKVTSDAGIENIIKNINGQGSALDRKAILNATIEDSEIKLTCEQARLLLENCSNLRDPIANLLKVLPQLSSAREAHQLVSGYLNIKQKITLIKKMGPLYGAMMGYATGSYCLDLSKSKDRNAGIRIAELAQCEKDFSKKKSGRGDTSLHGNWENFRNGKFNGESIILTCNFFARLPTKGKLEFDFVSTSRPKRGAKSISERRFSQLLQALQFFQVRYKTPPNTSVANRRWNKIRKRYIKSNYLNRISINTVNTHKENTEALNDILVEIQAIVGDRLLSAEQVKDIVHYIPDVDFAKPRTIQLLFSRIIDIENMFMVLNKLSLQDQAECARKLGWLNIINPMEPDRYYKLDLAVWEDRELAKILVKLAVEEPGENWIDESYTWANADEPVAGWELPASWAIDDETVNDGGPRKTGTLILNYYSGADQGCSPVWPVRKELQERTLCGTRLYL